MKKFLSLTLALLLCLGVFSACGGDTQPSPETSVPPTAAPSPEATPAPETDAPAATPSGTPDATQPPVTTPAPVPETDVPTTAPEPAPETGLSAIDVWNAIAAAVDSESLPASMMDMDADMLESFYGLGADSYADFVCKMPLMNVHATEICIVRATDAAAVSAGFSKRLADLDATWSQYLPAQYELVQNAQTVTNGDWMLLVVAQCADDVVAAFTAATN